MTLTRVLLTSPLLIPLHRLAGKLHSLANKLALVLDALKEGRDQADISLVASEVAETVSEANVAHAHVKLANGLVSASARILCLYGYVYCPEDEWDHVHFGDTLIGGDNDQ